MLYCIPQAVDVAVGVVADVDGDSSDGDLLVSRIGLHIVFVHYNEKTNSKKRKVHV